MGTKAYQKICPICQTSNEPNVILCRNCGAHIELRPNVPTTRLVNPKFEITEEIRKQVVEQHTPAAEGASLFLLSGGEPIAVRTEEEFILGRAGETTTEPMVDLTGFDAFSMGVSRRHAVVKSVGDKYILIDLNSSNGTWINGQRLVPTRPYDLPSGAVVQLGRLKLIISYLRPPAPKQAK